MKLLRKHQRVENNNGKYCSVIEHPLAHDKLNVAIATITGRYPEEKSVINRECDELVHVMDGQGKIIVNDQEYLLQAGDTLIIKAGEKYFWDGDMKLFMSCHPLWNKEQHQLVD